MADALHPYLEKLYCMSGILCFVEPWSVATHNSGLVTARVSTLPTLVLDNYAGPVLC